MRLSRRKVVESVVRRLSLNESGAVTFKTNNFETIEDAQKRYGLKSRPKYFNLFDTGSGNGYTISFMAPNFPTGGEESGRFVGEIFSSGNQSTGLVGKITFTNFHQDTDEDLSYHGYHAVVFAKLDISTGPDGAKGLVYNIYNRSMSILKRALSNDEESSPYVSGDLVEDTLDEIVSLLRDKFGMYVYVMDDDYSDKYTRLNQEYQGVFGKDWYNRYR